MANPIKPTPTLYGEDAERFLRIIEEPPSEETIAFINDVLETMEEYEPFMKIDDKTHVNQRKQK